MRLEPGDPTPSFSCLDHTGRELSDADLAGKKAVIYFYPRAFTPGCTTESCDFRDNYRAFQKAGYEVYGVSPDPVDRLEEFRQEHDLAFPLLSDTDHAMAEAFGAWGMKKNYGKEYEGIIRSTFTVEADGRIGHAWYNVRATGHVERVSSEVLE
jgi:peroxiredoxin Q/BCP